MRKHSVAALCAGLLLLVVVASFILRFRAIFFAYPLTVHVDETPIVEIALRFLQTSDLNPHFFNYPSLIFYLQSLVYALVSLWQRVWSGIPFEQIAKIDFYIAGRAFVVLLSTATVAITFEIGRRLDSCIAGLAAACFVGTSYLHLESSYVITVDAPLAFWALLATLMAALIYTRGPRTVYYLLGGVFAGLATSSKYTGFVSFAPILIAHIAAQRTTKRWFDANIILAVLAVPLAFVLTTPFSVLDTASFLRDVRHVGKHYAGGHPGAESQTNTSYLMYAGNLIREGYGLLPMLSALVGLAVTVRRDLWKTALVLSTPLLLFLFVGRYKVYFPRNLVALVPYLSLFSGFAFAAFFRAMRHLVLFGGTDTRDGAGGQSTRAVGRRVPELVKDMCPTALATTLKEPRTARVVAAVLTVLLLGAVLYAPTARSAERVRVRTLPDSRWIGTTWILENLPAGSLIGRENYTPPVEEFSDQFEVSSLGIMALVQHLERVNEMDYMLLSDGNYERLFEHPDRYPEERSIYQQFFDEHELVYELVPDDETLTGPTIRVYRITSSR